MLHISLETAQSAAIRQNLIVPHPLYLSHIQRVDIAECPALLDLRDPSTTPLNFTKSINLALSERGINAMRRAECAGLLESVLAETIPMHGRMIHGRRHGELYEESQSYDVHGRVSFHPSSIGLTMQS